MRERFESGQRNGALGIPPRHVGPLHDPDSTDVDGNSISNAFNWVRSSWRRWRSKATKTQPDPQRNFIFVLRLILAIGLALLALSLQLPRENPLHDFSESIAEALLISWIIARLVDPYVLSRFSHDLGTGVIWSLLSDDAPHELRKAFEAALRLDRYHKSIAWTITFEWEKPLKILKLTIRAVSRGQALGQGFSPAHVSWVLGSTDGYESRVESWSFDVSEDGIHIDKRLPEIAAFCDVQAGGRVGLDTTRFASGIVVGTGRFYTIDKTAVMFRRPHGYLPLVASSAVLESTFELKGSALADLDIEFILKDVGQPTRNPSRPDEYLIVVQELRWPGSTALVTWRVREDGNLPRDD